MKTSIFTISAVVLILLGSYIAMGYEKDSFTLKTFVIGGNRENTVSGADHMKRFVVGHGHSGKSMLIKAKKCNGAARKRNIEYIHRDEEIDKCIKKITKNWKSTYSKKSYEKEYDEEKKEWIITNEFLEKPKSHFGYDEDYSKLKLKLKKKYWSKKKIC